MMLRRLLFVLALLGCSSTPTKEEQILNHPAMNVLSQNEPIFFSGKYMEEFFQEWLERPDHKWPTQKDVDEWEKKKGYR